MLAIVQEIGGYFWRLIPANPILLRVVQMNGKRSRDLLIRCGYLGLLIGVVLITLMGGTNTNGDLTSLAKSSANLFQGLSYCQLGLVALLAPVFTAGAITQERDSQTYDILLTTPLSNGQIVLGSLLSRLFFVIALLVSGIPVFSITQIFGGVAISAIGQSFLIAAATALVTGAVAMAIAVFKVGTGRTIFAFYLFIVVYLVGTYILDDYLKFDVVNPVTGAFDRSKTSWMTGLNPFLALRTIFHDGAYLPPVSIGDLPESVRVWPLGWFLTNPSGFYVAAMFFISFVLVLPSILLLRKLAQSSASISSMVLKRIGISRRDRTRVPRAVWTNPIAWRKARTKASSANASMLRYGFMLAGMAGALVMAVKFYTLEPGNSKTYISASSHNAANNTLTVFHNDGLPPDTLPLDPVHQPDPPPEDASMPQSYSRYTYASPQVRASSAPNGPELDIKFVDDQSPEAEAKREQAKREDAKVDLKNLDISEVLGSMAELMSRVGRGDLAVDVWTRTESGKQAPAAWARIVAHAPHRKLGAADAHKILLGLIALEFAAILLIVTNAAASTVTREKEDGTLDLLLSSPITSKYYIWGKLRGLVSFVLLLVAVPAASAGVFVLCDLFRRTSDWSNPNFRWMVFPEALLLIPLMLIITASFAAILGMNMSLRCRKTVVAVMGSVGIIASLCGALAWAGYSLLDNKGAGGLSLGVAAFSPFTLLSVLINPYVYNQVIQGKNAIYGQENIASSRIAVFIMTLVAVLAYVGIVWAMYKSMVKNFDMTIRKQAR